MKINNEEMRDKFLEQRKTIRNKTILFGSTCVVGSALLVVFPPAVIVSLIGFCGYWYFWWKSLIVKCPNCGGKYGVGGKTNIGDGKHSCYHCGWSPIGKHAVEPKSHEKEWLQ